MKCNQCGSELRINREEYCKDVNGNPMFRDYAYCDTCRTKTPLQNNPNTFTNNPIPSNVIFPNQVPPKKKKRGWIIAVIAVIVIGGIFAALGDDSSEPESETTIADTTNDAKNTTENKDTKESKEKQDTPKKESDKKETTPTKKPKPTLSPKQQKAKEKKQAQAAKQKFIKSCKEFPYKKVMRNPDKYIGKKIKIKCQISQISEGGFFTKGFLRCYSYSGYGIYAENEYVVFDKRVSSSPKLLSDDIITVYGTIEEPEKMTRALTGTSEEVFTINMKYVKLNKS